MKLFERLAGLRIENPTADEAHRLQDNGHQAGRIQPERHTREARVSGFEDLEPRVGRQRIDLETAVRVGLFRVLPQPERTGRADRNSGQRLAILEDHAAAQDVSALKGEIDPRGLLSGPGCTACSKGHFPGARTTTRKPCDDSSSLSST